MFGPVPNAWLAALTTTRGAIEREAPEPHSFLETEAPTAKHQQIGLVHLLIKLPASTRYAFVACRWASAMVPPLPPPRKLWPERGEPAESLKLLYPLLLCHHHPLPEPPLPILYSIHFISFHSSHLSITPLSCLPSLLFSHVWCCPYPYPYLQSVTDERPPS